MYEAHISVLSAFTLQMGSCLDKAEKPQQTSAGEVSGGNIANHDYN